MMRGLGFRGLLCITFLRNRDPYLLTAGNKNFHVWWCLYLYNATHVDNSSRKDYILEATSQWTEQARRLENLEFKRNYLCLVMVSHLWMSVVVWDNTGNKVQLAFVIKLSNHHVHRLMSDNRLFQSAIIFYCLNKNFYYMSRASYTLKYTMSWFHFAINLAFWRWVGWNLKRVCTLTFPTKGSF